MRFATRLEDLRLRRLEHNGTFRACSRVISHWFLDGLLSSEKGRPTKNQLPRTRRRRFFYSTRKLEVHP